MGGESDFRTHRFLFPVDGMPCSVPKPTSGTSVDRPRGHRLTDFGDIG